MRRGRWFLMGRDGDYCGRENEKVMIRDGN